VKRVVSPHTYAAYSRLRAAEFTHLVTHLRESLDEAVGRLKQARAMDDVARAQAEIEVLEKILQYVDEGEALARKLAK
jgi:hypothetical protein